MPNSVVQAANSLPAPAFIGLVAFLLFVSTGGIPVPITATLLVAGALATAMPHGLLVWVSLLLASAISLTARDLSYLWLSSWGAAWLRRGAHHLAGRRRLARLLDHPAVRRWQRFATHYTMTSVRQVDALCREILQRGWFVIALTRFSPLATPLDIAAGALSYPPLAFLGGLFPGRLAYTLLLLGAGSWAGQAIQRHDAMLVVSAASTLFVIIMLLPALARRWLTHLTREPLSDGPGSEPAADLPPSSLCLTPPIVAHPSSD